ncbi:MAG: hypothetical protein ACR2GY_03250 [Phycisphaerales bacterium]
MKFRNAAARAVNRPDDESSLPAAARRRQLVRLAGLSVSLVLLVGAAWFVISQREEMGTALSHLRDPNLCTLSLFVAAVLGNLVLTGLLFSLLMARSGRVGLLEMQALMATSTLLNYLPLRPGLFGRVAYHKLVNNIEVRHTARVIVTAIALSILAAGVTCLTVAFVAITGAGPLIVLGAVAVVGVAGCVLPALRTLSLAFLLRMCDVMVWSVRYLLVFSLVGHPIGFETAVALAAVSMVSTMVPFLSNGLGLREWAIGLAAPLLAREFSSAADAGSFVDTPIAIAADLVNRGLELVVIAITGSVGALALGPRVRAVRHAQQSEMQV